MNQQEYTAQNKLTNAYFVKGSGFTGTVENASRLDAVEVAFLRTSFDNVLVNRL